MGRSHDYYCENCEAHYSGLQFKACPECGVVGEYDLNHDLPDTPNRVGEGWAFYRCPVHDLRSEAWAERGTTRLICDRCSEEVELIKVVPFSELEAAEQARDRAVEERDEASRMYDEADAQMVEYRDSLGPETARADEAEADRDRAVEALRELVEATENLAERVGVPSLAPEFPALYEAALQARPILQEREPDATVWVGVREKIETPNESEAVVVAQMEADDLWQRNEALRDLLSTYEEALRWIRATADGARGSSVPPKIEIKRKVDSVLSQSGSRGRKHE